MQAIPFDFPIIPILSEDLAFMLIFDTGQFNNLLTFFLIKLLYFSNLITSEIIVISKFNIRTFLRLNLL